VLVDAHGAEFDLIQSARREIGTGRRSGKSLMALFSGRRDPTLATGPGFPGTPNRRSDAAYSADRRTNSSRTWRAALK